MEHPVKETAPLIHTLCSGTPAEQRAALETYFTPSASFRHAICYVPSFEGVQVPLLGEVDSRWVIGCVYRWYKVISPRVVVDVESVVFDKPNLRLYVSMSQLFSLFIIPFYAAKVPLVTVLHLTRARDDKFYITSQVDLYEPQDFVRFFWPGGQWVVKAVQWVVVMVCVFCALVLAPPVRVFQRAAGWKMD